MSLAVDIARGFSGYFERTPEKLVLEGYRHWLAGFETGSVGPWERAHMLYSSLLGDACGRRALGELSHFVRTLRRCAACPLLSFPFGAHHVCRDECLALGLVAGLQNGDEAASDTCLSQMCCGLMREEVGEAAASFAGTLSQMHLYLLPIPKPAIDDILQRSSRKTVH